MPVQHLPYRDTNRFTPIVLDHLAGAPFLLEFQMHTATRAGLEAARNQRMFDPAMRQVLVDAIVRRYKGFEPHPAVEENIRLLRHEGTTTITTGHQLCLFTGPWYVPYKILNVIRLARELSAPGKAVVPVFWLASEDHDLAEADHTYVRGQKVQWKGAGRSGAVGRMKLDGIESTIDEVSALLGVGPNADQLRRLLSEHYMAEHTMAQAAHGFIHALFGRFGLVIVDGDDAALKRAFIPAMREEVLNNVAQRAVNYASEKLAERYKLQAHAREINLFALSANERVRLEAVGDGFEAGAALPHLSLDGLLEHMERRPEDISPNVLLRPVYQEVILPNIAYVGGGGELAYWLQLRWLFQALQVPMPALVLRTSAMDITSKQLALLSKLGLGLRDVFADVDGLSASIAKRLTQHRTELDHERDVLSTLYSSLEDRLGKLDPTLRAAVQARGTKALKGVETLQQKAVRAAKREQSTALEQLHRLLNELLPGGSLAERRDNFMPAYAAEGPALFDRLLDQLDPLRGEFTMILEEA